MCMFTNGNVEVMFIGVGKYVIHEGVVSDEN